MGCAASRGVNPIDAAMLQALIEAKKKRNLQHLTFNELLLKFPKVLGCKMHEKQVYRGLGALLGW